MNRPMTLLLIEDNTNECNKFLNYAKTNSNIKFIGVTDSDIEGLAIVKTNKPDGIILDIELNKGSGSCNGFNFLLELKKLNLSYKPKIVVTTNISAEDTYEFLHNNGVSMIFHKKQINYSAQAVVNTLLLFKSCGSNIVDNNETENRIKKEERIISATNKELDTIGVASYLVGRKYLLDAILFTIDNINKFDTRITVVQHLVKKYKKNNTTISKGMQNAILHAFRVTSPDDIERIYTGTINYETGYPTPTDFIHHYANKIIKEI